MPSAGSFPRDEASSPRRHEALGSLRHPRSSRAVAGVAVVALGIATAAALLEWAGWRIIWRHAGGVPTLDAAWRAAFLEGAGRTMAGAWSAGVLAAGATLGLATLRSWSRPRARRWTAAALVAGAAGFLATLTLLTLWAE